MDELVDIGVGDIINLIGLPAPVIRWGVISETLNHPGSIGNGGVDGDKRFQFCHDSPFRECFRATDLRDYRHALCGLCVQSPTGVASPGADGAGQPASAAGGGGEVVKRALPE